MVPLRFVAVCPGGHIEDFPWLEWAHYEKGKLAPGSGCDEPLLRLITTGRAGLEGLKIRCESCGAGRSLMTAGAPEALRPLGCSGQRPWLGPDGAEAGCPGPLKVAQRGATNIYFANVASSILIPPYTSKARRLLEDRASWNWLIGADGGTFEDKLRAFATLKKVPIDEVRRAVDEKRQEPPERREESEEDYRYAEYLALLDTSRPAQEELRLVPQDIGRYEAWFRSFAQNVVLVEKLAETRALTGFSRLSPDLAAAAWSPKLGQLSLATRQNWLPAIRVYGEGIFLQLSSERLREWETPRHPELDELSRRYGDVARTRGRQVQTVPPVFVVLHTFAHLLIRRLSFECGYGSSSLRERIYCRRKGDQPMAGILIYTAAGDSEGTLGGLVSQGKPGRLESVIRAALDDARWCSSDPLCMESEGQGTDSLNLAACHACSLLPETSCEMGNRLLDRGCLVGSAPIFDRGFFGLPTR